jgi:uncharacterized protein
MALKRIRQFVLGILVGVCLGSALRAEPIKQLKPTGYINDFAGVIDADSAQAILSLCEQIDHEARAQIAVVTIHSTDGADIESYASDLYKAWGIGPKSDNRGVLILLAVNDHHYRIEVGYGLEPILPDGKVGGFGREAVPLLRQNQYGPALRLMTRRVAEVIADDAHVRLQGTEAPSPAPYPPPSESTTPTWVVVVGILVVVAFLALLARLGGGGLLWFLLGMFLGGGGGRSSGGWSGGGGWGGGGGFGSGGGFGGFGGGSSGGGGASGSW